MLKMLFDRCHHLTLPYRVSVSTWLMTSVGHGIVLMSTFHSLIRHRGHHDTCGTGNAYASGVPDCTSGFHRGSCCPVICVFLFHVIVLSFGFGVFIVPFV